MPRLEIDRVEESGAQLLGPGKRLLVWLHGCSRNCPSCIVERHNRREGAAMSLSASLLADTVCANPDIEGVTVSGGEPFLQAVALLAFIRSVASCGKGVIIYSGYTLEELSARPLEREILQYTDVLIDGPYVRELDDGKAFRGSSNQKIHLLTQRYASFYADTGMARTFSIKQKGSALLLTGIPNEGSRQIWGCIKRKGESL